MFNDHHEETSNDQTCFLKLRFTCRPASNLQRERRGVNLTNFSISFPNILPFPAQTVQRRNYGKRVADANPRRCSRRIEGESKLRNSRSAIRVSRGTRRVCSPCVPRPFVNAAILIENSPMRRESLRSIVARARARGSWSRLLPLSGSPTFKLTAGSYRARIHHHFSFFSMPTYSPPSSRASRGETRNSSPTVTLFFSFRLDCSSTDNRTKRKRGDCSPESALLRISWRRCCTKVYSRGEVLLAS